MNRIRRACRAALVFVLVAAGVATTVATQPPDCGTATGPPCGFESGGTWEFVSSAPATSFGSGVTWSTLHLSRSGGEVSGTHTNTVYASEVCEAPHGCFYKVDAIVEGHVVGTVSDQEIALEFSPTGDGQPTRFNGRVDNDGRTIRGDGWQAVRTQTPRSLLSLPGTPTGLSWTVREDNGDVRLQWTDNSSGESGFAVWGRCLDGGWVQGITNGNFTGLSFHLMAGSSESYCVTAYDIMFWQVPTSSPAGERYFLSPPSNIVEVSVP